MYTLQAVLGATARRLGFTEEICTSIYIVFFVTLVTRQTADRNSTEFNHKTLRSENSNKRKGKSEVHPRTGYEGTYGE
jgi:hypothetical protein